MQANTKRTARRGYTAFACMRNMHAWLHEEISCGYKYHPMVLLLKTDSSRMKENTDSDDTSVNKFPCSF